MNKYKKTANEIKQTYESNLFTLDLNRQTHFSQRMYRIGGEKRYIQPIVNAYKCIESEIEEFIKRHKDSSYIAGGSKKQFDKFSGKSEKDRFRRKVFSGKNKEFLLYAYILLKVKNWKDFNIKEESRKKAEDIFKKIDFNKYFSDKDLIQYYCTQLINTAYDLKITGKDYTGGLIENFKSNFMDIDDGSLKDFEFCNKIYGLTHIIIAESGYYQKWVSKKKFGWILEYFNDNIDEVLKRTNVDIVAEVGICFVLCGSNRGKIIKKVKDLLIEKFDKKIGCIPRCKTDVLGRSEHTNIISYMMLYGFNRLYKGPNLKKYY